MQAHGRVGGNNTATSESFQCLSSESTFVSKAKGQASKGDGDLCDNDGTLGYPEAAQVGRIDLDLHSAPTWCPAVRVKI